MLYMLRLSSINSDAALVPSRNNEGNRQNVAQHGYM